MRGNPEGHDTLGVIALDKDGKISVGKVILQTA